MQSPPSREPSSSKFLRRRLLQIHNTVITGFNTDIQHEGVTYHVQTEDKGLDSPLILSLIYVGGAIIASKRTPYHDLISSGFDESVLTERLQRQHKLICAAISNGRIEDLKRMGERAGASKSAGLENNGAGATNAQASPHDVSENASPEIESTVEAHDGSGSEIQFAQTSVVDAFDQNGFDADGAALRHEEDGEGSGLRESEAEPLYLSLLDDEGEFRAGQLATIKIRVGRGQFGHVPVADAAVSIKVLGTTFRPLILSTATDAEGLAVVRALLPGFTTGRAAIIIRAGVDGDAAELRRIIHQ